MQVFIEKTDYVTNRLNAKTNHRIKNMSKNIEVMLLKLDTSNVPLVRHKMTPIALFPWQQFAFGSISCLIDALIFLS